MKFLLFLFIGIFLSFTSIGQNNRFDIVITEIMADPTPQVGLPNYEYIEIRNRTTTNINIQGFRISDATSTATISASYILKADSSVVLCGTTAASFLSAFGPVIAVTSFPSLDNDGELISLRNAQLKNLHALNYSSNWHSNNIKKDGGWSLEMIDINKPCVGTGNWTSSTNPLGGSIGKTNSVNASTTIEQTPQIINAFPASATSVLVSFKNPIDSISGAALANYTFSNSINIIAAIPQAPLFTTVLLSLSQPLQAQQVYTITTNAINNCTGNSIAANSQVKVGITQPAALKDIIINEILFDPKDNGVDFVELYNNSSKLINAKELFLANRSGTAIANQVLASLTDRIIFPGDFFVITEDTAIITSQYAVLNNNAYSQLANLPTYSDDKGNCVVTNNMGTVIDELAYLDDWHFPLLSNKKGVSLERISYAAATQDATNWTSAAVSTNNILSGATPTYKNSQFLSTTNLGPDPIVLNPKVFSPDGDGFDDRVAIQINLTEPGYVANVYIFDANGRQVKHLVKNALLSQNNQFTWNGLGEQNQALNMGNYIVVTELFKTNGQKKQYKNVVSLARRL